MIIPRRAFVLNEFGDCGLDRWSPFRTEGRGPGDLEGVVQLMTVTGPLVRVLGQPLVSLSFGYNAQITLANSRMVMLEKVAGPPSA
ncbi:MAG: hypothetical protein JWP75_2794 [Frondihabitans sp.]|nr:hypothetical protein [Frondihabitans sp.]